MRVIVITVFALITLSGCKKDELSKCPCNFITSQGTFEPYFLQRVDGVVTKVTPCDVQKVPFWFDGVECIDVN